MFRAEHFRFAQVLILILCSWSLPAAAESIIVCGDSLRPGSEVTVAQWISGPDDMAPVLKRAHWRILHHKIAGNYCPFFEIERSLPVYIRAQTPDGTLTTLDQYGMYSYAVNQPVPRYTGNYQLFLETQADPDTNIYSWYREPMMMFDDGVVRASPTVGMSHTDKWETIYPLKSGFEERRVPDDDSAITIQ